MSMNWLVIKIIIKLKCSNNSNNSISCFQTILIAQEKQAVSAWRKFVKERLDNEVSNRIDEKNLNESKLLIHHRY